MSNTMYRGARVPAHRALFAAGNPLAPVWTEEYSSPSSGNAYLIMTAAGVLTAGSVSKLSYRKKKSGERPLQRLRRIENLFAGAVFASLAAGDGVAATITPGRPDPFGGNTATRIQGSRSTQDGSNYSGGSIAITEGAIPATGTARVSLYARSVTGATQQVLVSGGAATLTGTVIAVDAAWRRISPAARTPAAGSAHYVQVMAYGATGSLAIDVDVCAVMLEDQTGLDSSVPSEFVAHDANIGYGAGILYRDRYNGNTVDGSYYVSEREGALIPDRGGQQPLPAVTGLAANSTPSSGVELTVTDAPACVAGLPAKRYTATSANSTHVIQTVANSGASRTLFAIVGKPANNLAKPLLYHYGGGSLECIVAPNDDWSASMVTYDPTSKILAHGLRDLGNDGYEIFMTVDTDNETSATDILAVARHSSPNLGGYVGGGEYIDVACFNSCNLTYYGTPVLAFDGATSRLADDAATVLSAIGTGAFTAFIDFTIRNLPALGGVYPFLFSSSDERAGVCLFVTGSTLHYIKDNVNQAGLDAVFVSGVRNRAIIRRNSAGDVAVFVGGSKKLDVSSTAYNSTTSPRFGSIEVGFTTDAVVFHDQWIEYSALSDEDCIRVTRV
jgi:hypothetical protein